MLSGHCDNSDGKKNAVIDQIGKFIYLMTARNTNQAGFS
jgi:hypothetical protein